MFIRNNEKLQELLAKRDKAYEKYSEGLNTLNAQYDPIKVELRKSRNNRIYFLGVVLSAIVLFSFIFLLMYEDFPGYLAYIIYALLFVSLCFAIFLLVKTLKKLEAITIEWTKQYDDIAKYLKEGNEHQGRAAEEAIKVICENKYHDEIGLKKKELPAEEFALYWQKILEKEKELIAAEMGDTATAEEVIEYYKRWGKRFTRDEDTDYDKLLAARRKRHLRE